MCKSKRQEDSDFDKKFSPEEYLKLKIGDEDGFQVSSVQIRRYKRKQDQIIQEAQAAKEAYLTKKRLEQGLSGNTKKKLKTQCTTRKRKLGDDLVLDLLEDLEKYPVKKKMNISTNFDKVFEQIC